MNPIRLFILRLRAFVWTAFALSCIGLAVLVGLATLILPYAERFRPEVETVLAERLGRPVHLENIQARWTITGPQLTLQGLGIGSRDDPESMLWVDMATVGYDVYGWLRPDRRGMGYFRLFTDHLELIRHGDGQWSLAGLGGGPGAGGEGALEWVLTQGGISATAGEFLLVDEVEGKSLRLSQANLELRNLGDRQMLSARLASASGQGEIRVESEARLDADGALSLSAYVQAEELDLAGWFQDFPLGGADVLAGTAGLELWADWNAGTLHLRGDVLAENLVLAGHRGLADGESRLATRYGLDRVSGAMDLSWRSGQSWQLELADFSLERSGHSWPLSGLAVARRQPGDLPTYDLAGDYARIEDLAGALVVFEVLPESLRQTLHKLALHGELRSFRLAGLQGGWPLRAEGVAEVQSLSMAPFRRIPGLANLSGRLQLTGEDGAFHADARDVFVSLPGVLRWPAQLGQVRARVAWRPEGERWRLDIDDIDALLGSARVQGRYAMLVGDGTRPFIDLMAEVSDGPVAEAYRYWPINRFKPRLIDWLDRSLVEGTVKHGVVVLYGDMDDWPFEGNQGRFEARAEVEAATLDYHPEWPHLTDLDASLQFFPQGITGQSRRALVGDLPVSRFDAELPRFREPRLTLTAEGRAPASDLLAFLKQSPINDTHGPYLAGLEVNGTGTTRVSLDIPFGTAGGTTEVIGDLWLEDSLITDRKWNVSFAETTGQLAFSHVGMEAVELKTSFRGYPATLSFWTGDSVQAPGAAAQGRLVGLAPAGAILEDFPLLRPVLDRIPGACVWEAELIVDRQGRIDLLGDQAEPRLVLKSDLVGAEMDLPPPFAKPAGEALPLTVSTRLPDLVDDLEIAIGEIARLRVAQDPDSGRWSGHVHFGPGEVSTVAGEGLRLGGHIEELDADQWRDVISELLDLDVEQQEDQHWVSGMDLTVGRLHLAGREFTNLAIQAERDAEYWNLTLNGDQMDGRLRLPLSPDPNRLMLAEFERLEWQSVDRDMPSAGLRPDRIPPLRFFAQELTFLDIPVGTTSFESYPTLDGMHIDQLETQSDVLSVSASGDWLLEGDGEVSRFAGTVTGEDFGRILDSFGFSGMVSGGQTIIKLDAEWDGAPSDFELAIVGGDLDINIGPGQITEVEPGAGRIFGLLSLTQIPRRLRLDFGDLFKSGMVFDSIRGNFMLEAGDAFTDNLEVKAPTADVQIRGRTGLVEQDYNQIITVIPQLGDTLPLVGALAGGGAGAAALLVVQGLFGGQIERITQYHYAVTGGWDDPAVELLGANSGQVSMDVPTGRTEG